MSNLFQNWSKNELVIYCYDKRPELYACLTAETRREEILAWLEPQPISVSSTIQVINNAEKIQGQFIKSKVEGNTFNFS